MASPVRWAISYFIIRPRTPSLDLHRGGHTYIDSPPRTRRQAVIRKPTKRRPPVRLWRARWLKVMKEHPGSGVWHLRKLLSYEYGRLYRKDRDWLQRHSPREQNPRRPHSRIDWDARDISVSKKMHVAAYQVREQLPLTRVTGAAICRATGMRWSLLMQQLGHLPQCREVLRNTLETPADFACRRILTLAKECASAGIVLKPWRLFIRARIEYRTQNIPKVQEAMREAQILMREGVPLPKAS